MELKALRQNQIFRHRRKEKIGFPERRILIKNSSTNIATTKIKRWDKEGIHVVESRGNSLSTLFSSSLAEINKHVDVAGIVQGKGLVLQGKNSAVKLHVPDGVHGVILAKIHKNHAKFLNFISKSECIIGPICEYSLQKYSNASPMVSGKVHYKLQIPHILKDAKNMRQHVRVRQLNSSGQTTNCNNDSENDIQYDIDEDYVTIYTSHFSEFIVTAETLNHCASSALALIFGSIRNIPDVKPLASVKIYLSSPLFQIDDYREDLVKSEAMSENPFSFLATCELALSTEPYDASKSTIEITLEGPETWKTYSNTPNKMKKPLHKALKYVDGHICKSNPTEFQVFYMESKETVAHHVRAFIRFEESVCILNNEGHANDTTIERGSQWRIVDLFQKIQLTSEKKRKSEMSAFEDEREEELTHMHLHHLARRLTNKSDLQRLALTLGIAGDRIDAHIHNYPNDMISAAYEILTEWFRYQKVGKDAYASLRGALKRTDMNHLNVII